MEVRHRSRLLVTCAAPVVALMATARAGEPSAHELALLAPVIDSSDASCRSIDVGGNLWSNKGQGPRLKFRALYRSPGRSSFIFSDATDGTPLILCSGRKMLVYDPVGPAVYYSENSSFRLEMACNKDTFRFDQEYLLNSNKNSKILVDLRSILTGEGWTAMEGSFSDQIDTIDKNRYKLTRKVDNCFF